MPTKFTVTLTSLGNSAVIVIPKPVVDGFGLKMGDKLEVIANACGISIPLKEKKN
jgi:AbrB family looped-hinge helix DNA binding protein